MTKRTFGEIYGYRPYDVIRYKSLTGIIVSVGEWGCKIMFEAWDGGKPTAVEMANYSWTAVLNNFRTVG